MRVRKFRAWVKKTVNNRISLPVHKAYEEFADSETEARAHGKFDEWYDARSNRIDELIDSFSEAFPDTEDFTISYHMMYNSVSLGIDGNAITRPCSCEVLEVMDYVEILDAYEGDLLIGTETDEYGYHQSSWVGVIKFNEDLGRIMVLDKDVDEWFEVDDFMFDYVQTIDTLDLK